MAGGQFGINKEDNMKLTDYIKEELKAVRKFEAEGSEGVFYTIHAAGYEQCLTIIRRAIKKGVIDEL
jgi:hypothetical protein